jgi:prepilin-type processing-associated H-X9-DG protein
MGMLNYHDVEQRLPPNNQTSPTRHNWAAFMLRFTEQESLYEIYRWDIDWDDAGNQPAITRHIAYLFCPSTPGGNERVDVVSATVTAATSDYAPPANVAPAPINAGFVPATGNTHGAISNDRKVRLADVLDGTSHTILVTEDGGRPEFWIRGRRGPDTNNPGGGNLAVAGGRVQGSGWANQQNSIPLHGFTQDGLSVPGPCPMNCTNNNEAFSFHPGSVQAVFADGSVRTLREQTAIAIYAALITRAGGEIISGSEF